MFWYAVQMFGILKACVSSVLIPCRRHSVLVIAGGKWLAHAGQIVI